MTGIAHCKKSAKQEAAKNVLQFLIVSNILPLEAYKKLENVKKIFQNNSQDITIGISSIKISEPVLPAEVSKITELSSDTLTNYIEPISNNIAMQNITVENGTTAYNDNNNTIKNTHINIYQRKSTETVYDCTQILENNPKKLSTEKPTVESTLVTSSENVQSSHIESNSDNTKEQNLVIKNDHTNILSLTLFNNDKRQRTIEDDLRKFNVEIIDNEENKKSTLPLTEISRKALSAYVTSGVLDDTGRRKSINMDSLTNSHNLFKHIYSNKIPNDLRERMHIVCQMDNYKSNIVETIYQDIQKALGVKLKQINCNNYRTGVTIICVRMLSTPIIAQFGIGATEKDAKAQAMFAIINTILEYLK
ncbi:hypothetical protein EAI_08869 [Harpegnathos saltator]|uniref:DRBM domain-containing protein n=2 Tax=Harpegnathos saltator TaxID=610380 RepID=E2CA49_HARSA|nr:hypothetical protein EAI_08869 [Harpegnathos saltator]